MRVVIRTSGNHKQGMGDVMGSLAIAEEFTRQNNRPTFIVDEDMEARNCISGHGYSVECVHKEEEELALLESLRPDAVVVNQLNSPIDYLTNLKKRTGLLATIDDTGPGARVADLRFNPLYYIPDSYYGSEFVPLRREFIMFHQRNKDIKKEARDILVTLGGSDTHGFTPKMVQALSGLSDGVKVTVVLGAAYRHFIELEEAIKQSHRRFDVVKNVPNMYELLFSSDLVVCGGGNTLLEAACLGTPAVVVCGEKFEEETASMLASKGFSINLGFGEDVSVDTIYTSLQSLIGNSALRREMSQRGKGLVDGLGARRIVEKILSRLNDTI